MFAGNFAPRGWALCDGSLLAVSSNDALFSILGTTYGGDGRTTFGLPDLRGRAPVQRGSGPGLPTYNLGQKTGTETNTLTLGNLPPHNHNIPVSTDDANSGEAENKVMAVTNEEIYNDLPSSETLYGNGLGQTGGGTPVSNMMPSIAINYIIALIGLYPSRH